MTKSLKNKKNEKYTLNKLGYGEYTEKLGKLDTNTVGPGIWGETEKNVKNEKYKLKDLDYGKKKN